jgi:hypothetical protein
VLHGLPELFFVLPLVECGYGVVEGAEALGDLFGEVGGVLAQAAVLGLDLGGAVLVFADGAVGGIEAELAAADLLGEVGVVLEDRGRVGEAGQADAVDLGMVAQGVFGKGTGHRDDHRLLALADVPAAQVVGEDQPLGVAAGVGGEARLDAGDLAGGQTVTSVEEDTVGG